MCCIYNYQTDKIKITSLKGDIRNMISTFYKLSFQKYILMIKISENVVSVPLSEMVSLCNSKKLFKMVDHLHKTFTKHLVTTPN